MKKYLKSIMEDVMKRISWKTIVAVSLLYVFAASAPVLAADGKNYFDFKVGGYFPQKDFLKEGDPGIGTELAFGHHFHRNFAAELGVAYFQSTVPVFTAFGSKVDTTFRIYPVTLNLVVSERFGDFEPFAKAGAGWYFANIDEPVDTKSSSAFGYQFGAGAIFKNFGIEGKYLSAKTTLLRSKSDISGFTSTVFYRAGF